MTLSEYNQIVDKAWALVEVQGLDSTDAEAIAVAASVPVVRVRGIVPNQEAVILLLVADILPKIQVTPNVQLSKQDQLFDVIMQGFDIAESRKQAIKKLWQEVIWKPWIWPQILPPFQKKFNEIVEALMAKEDFVQGVLTAVGVRAVFLKTFLVWLDDETLDLSKTMATLDQSLKKYDELSRYVS